MDALLGAEPPHICLLFRLKLLLPLARQCDRTHAFYPHMQDTYLNIVHVWGGDVKGATVGHCIMLCDYDCVAESIMPCT